jgi:hypothetical protein
LFEFFLYDLNLIIVYFISFNVLALVVEPVAQVVASVVTDELVFVALQDALRPS